jgi:hypothetical protein
VRAGADEPGSLGDVFNGTRTRANPAYKREGQRYNSPHVNSWNFFGPLLALLASANAAPRSDGTPYIDKSGSIPHLMVDGKPFLLLGGELRNSSTSSLETMKPIWPHKAADKFAPGNKTEN